MAIAMTPKLNHAQPERKGLKFDLEITMSFKCNQAEACGPVKAPKVHQVTPEIMERGNKLIAEAEVASQRAIDLSKQRDVLEKMAEEIWDECRSKREEAARLFLGENKGYRGY